MSKEIYKDRAIEQYFQGKEDLSSLPLLNAQIMYKVRKVQKRREIRNLFITGSTSLCLTIGVVCMLKYYWGFSFSDLFHDTISNMKMPSGLSFPSPLPILFICVIVSCLLGLDYLLHKKLSRT